MNLPRVVKIVAGALCVTALLTIQHDWRSYVDFLAHPIGVIRGWGPLAFWLRFFLMWKNLIKFPTAVALFQRKRWGWTVAVVVLTIDVLLGITATFRGFDLVRKEVGPEQPIYVQDLGWWRLYLASLVGIVSLVILIPKRARRLFQTRNSSA